MLPTTVMAVYTATTTSSALLEVALSQWTVLDRGVCIQPVHTMKESTLWKSADCSRSMYSPATMATNVAMSTITSNVPHQHAPSLLIA